MTVVSNVTFITVITHTIRGFVLRKHEVIRVIDERNSRLPTYYVLNIGVHIIMFKILAQIDFACSLVLL